MFNSNMIEEVSAQMGEFDLKVADTEMHARLPKTKGTLSGIFKVDLVMYVYLQQAIQYLHPDYRSIYLSRRGTKTTYIFVELDDKLESLIAG